MGVFVLPTSPETVRQRRYFLATVVGFCLLNLQMISATGRLVEGDSGPQVKLYHLLFAAFAVFLLARGRLPKWRAEVAVYFVVVISSGLAAYLRYGVRPMMVNYVFAAYTVVIGSIFGSVLGSANVLKALRVTAGALLIAVVMKAILYAHVILAFLAAPLGHPGIPIFYGGGPNLEASWIALGAAFFIGSRLFFPYWLLSLVIAAVYASRTAIIIALLVLAGAALAALFRARVTSPLRVSIIAGSIGTAVIGAVIAFQVLQSATGIGYVIQRFANIGEEAGSVGRLVLWTGGIRAFQDHPFGVGQGNAIPEVEDQLGADVPEDSLHNVFLQHLVDTGIQGLLALVIFVGMTGVRTTRSAFRNPLLLYASIYLLAGLIQFRGTDAMFWFVYGLEMGSANALAPGNVPGAVGQTA